MCNVGDDNLDDEAVAKYMEAPTATDPSQKLCNKCRQSNACLVLRNKDFYCRNCFLDASLHKFKALLGKHKLIRPNDEVLIVLNLGAPSAALLHFIKTGLELETAKKLKFKPHFLFIDEFYYLSVEERLELSLNIEQIILSYNFKPQFGNLVQLINDHTQLFEACDLVPINKDDQLLLDNYLQNAKTTNKSEQIDYLNIVRRKTLLKIAEKLHCKFIFTPELSADVSSQLLANISLGRGGHIQLDTGFCDSRYPAVKILRPLRLFDENEMALYCKFHNLKIVSCRKADKGVETVQSLIRKFVDDLQVNYPATVTTIMKTGDRVQLGEGKKCQLCEGPVENLNNLSAAESIRISHSVSTEKIPINEMLKNLQQFQSDYCFSCRKLQTHLCRN